jgi:hypothetical protein
MIELKKWAKYLFYPVSFRRRDWALFRKLANNNNEVTSAELLEIELGKAVLDDIAPGRKGLAAKDDPLRTVIPVVGMYKNPHMKYMHINPLFNTLMSMISAGFCRTTPRNRYKLKKMSGATVERDYRTIYMNRIFVFSPIGQLMFLSWFHSMALEGAKRIADRLHGVAKLASEHRIALPLAASLGISHSRSAVIRLLEYPVACFADTVGHEHIHFLQKRDRDTGATGFNVMARTFQKAAMARAAALHPGIAKADRIASLGTNTYFGMDHEIEARLHTTLAHGARRWGRLPKTRLELWLALDDCGLAVPAAIKQELAAAPAEALAAAADFLRRPGLGAKLSRISRRAFSPDIAELRIAQNTLIDKELKAEHWRETLPYLYGHLLELYGRPTGRAEMGFAAAGGVTGTTVVLAVPN